MESIVEKNIMDIYYNDNHSDDCHVNRSEEQSIINMENLLTKSEDDDHFGGEEDTKGN